MTSWLERHQVLLYLAALTVGAVVGLAVAEVSGPAQLAATPVLALLLYATFLGVPFASIGHAVRDRRFLITALVLNFVVVPLVVFALSRFVAHDQVLLVGVLFVLLTPCVDYVITFTGLAGGAKDRLLANAPVLMLAQMVLLPAYLWLFIGADFVATIDVEPFIAAFVFLIVVPMLAAGLTQFAAARSRRAAQAKRATLGAMVPLLMLTLAVIVTGHVGAVSQRLGPLLKVVPLYVAFAVVMVPLGMVVARWARLGVAGTRAVVFSGVTRNSLVVLPLVLALPATYDLAPLVVVTQTLVELLIMVILVRLIPRVIRNRP